MPARLAGLASRKSQLIRLGRLGREVFRPDDGQPPPPKFKLYSAFLRKLLE